MEPKSDSRLDAHNDLVALLSVAVFVLGFGLGLFATVFYSVGPTVLGPFDAPIENPNPILIVLVVLAFGGLFSIGALVGGWMWVIVMSRFLPRKTLFRWLTYGPQIKPLLEFNLRLLNRMYGSK